MFTTFMERSGLSYEATHSPLCATKRQPFRTPQHNNTKGVRTLLCLWCKKYWLQSQSAQIYQHRLGGEQIRREEPQQHNCPARLIYIYTFSRFTKSVCTCSSARGIHLSALNRVVLVASVRKRTFRMSKMRGGGCQSHIATREAQIPACTITFIVGEFDLPQRLFGIATILLFRNG